MKKFFSKIFKGLFTLIICVALIITGIVTFQTFLLGSVNVEGPSMKPTIEEKGAVAYYLINGYKLDYGDIVIAYAPSESEPQGVCPSEVKNSFSTFVENYKEYFNNLSRLVKRESATAEKEPVNGYVCVIKRVIGLPGDTVTIADGKLYVNGEEKEESYILEDMIKKHSGESYGVKNDTWILEDDEYFILGDNRNVSRDSEDYGPVKDTQILGKVWMVKQKGKMITAGNLD